MSVIYLITLPTCHGHRTMRGMNTVCGPIVIASTLEAETNIVGCQRFHSR